MDELFPTLSGPRGLGVGRRVATTTDTINTIEWNVYDEPSPRKKRKKIVDKSSSISNNEKGKEISIQENTTSPQFKASIKTRSSTHTVEREPIQEQEELYPDHTQESRDVHNNVVTPSPFIKKKKSSERDSYSICWRRIFKEMKEGV